MDEGITHPDENLMGNGDLCESIISRFKDSTREDQQRLCAVIGSMSQELKDQNIPLTSVAYFGATCSSLVKLFSEVEPPIHLVEALLTILSLLLPRISVAILKKKKDFVLELVRHALKLPSLSIGAATSGLKCITQFLIVGDGSNWSELFPLFLTLLEFVTDSRPKVNLYLSFFLEWGYVCVCLCLVYSLSTGDGSIDFVVLIIFKIKAVADLQLIIITIQSSIFMFESHVEGRYRKLVLLRSINLNPTCWLSINMTI